PLQGAPAEGDRRSLAVALAVAAADALEIRRAPAGRNLRAVGDDRPPRDPRAVPDERAVADDGVLDARVGADAHLVEEHAVVDLRAVADHDPLAEAHVRPDLHAGSKLGARRNQARGLDGDSRRLAPRAEVR